MKMMSSLIRNDLQRHFHGRQQRQRRIWIRNQDSVPSVCSYSISFFGCGLPRCATVRKNHAIPTRFLPQKNANSTEIRTYGVFLFVRGMTVRGMEEGLAWIIPLTIIPLTSLRPCPSSVGHLHVHFGCGLAALRLLSLFAPNQPKCLSMSMLRKIAAFFNQAQSSPIKPNRAIYQIITPSPFLAPFELFRGKFEL